MPPIARSPHRTAPSPALASARLLLVALLVACLHVDARSAAASIEDQLPKFVDAEELDPNIPAPGHVIGHRIGADAVRYEALVRYLRALDDASDRVALTPYGETHEGRTLYYLTITSKANHARLDEIRSMNAKLADPRGLGDEEADEILDTLPGIAWLAYAIHGDEVSPTDSAMVVAYVLAASDNDTIARLRDELVIHIDPLQNPDGRERYLSQIQTMRGKVSNPDIRAMHHAGLWSAGRGNHYLFDMNRDWMMQTQPETRGRTRAMLAWRPHLVVDSHEMSGLDTYLFDPPREPINRHIASSVLEWRVKMSEAQAEAFNRFGWSYYTEDWYEEWYPGYTNAWGSLIGGIGMLYEQAGVSGDAVTQSAGNVFSYDVAVHQNVVGSFANLRTLLENRRAILADFLNEQRWAVSSEAEPHGTFIFPPAADESRRHRLIETLERQGIEYTVAAGEFDAHDIVDVWGDEHESKTFPASTIVVPSAQPLRRLVHSILGFDLRFSDEFLLEEREHLEKGKGSRMYDVSGWNLSMAYGLEAYTAGRVSNLEPAETADDDAPDAKIPGRAAYGYVIEFDNADVYTALARLFDAGAKVRAARKPFTLDGVEHERGTLLLRGPENPAKLGRIVRDALDGLHLTARAANTALTEDGPDLGSRQFRLLHAPRVAIASQWPVSTYSFGSTWFLLDARTGLRASPINIQNVGRMDLRKYNVLILPSMRSLRSVLSGGARDRLRTWVESGGTLIAIGAAATSLADEDSGMSSVRLRRDVLEELGVYAEYVERDRASREVSVDPEAVWDGAATDAASDESESESKAKSGRDIDALKRHDAWARRFSPRGAILAGELDPEHWLCFGLHDLDDRLPLFVRGSSVLMSKPPADTPVRLASADGLRLSGLLWPEARERLADSAYATVERVGNGQVILFADEPFFRGYWEGTGRLMLNAVLLGPGMGTSQPLPW